MRKWLDVATVYIGTLIYWWLEDGYTGSIQDWSRSTGKRDLIIGLLNLWFTISDYLGDGFSTRYLQWLLSRLWVDGSITDNSLVQMDKILIDSRWDCIDRNHVFWPLTILFNVTEITGKILLDRNLMYSFTVYRIHSYCYCLLLLLHLPYIWSLFTDILYRYCHYIIPII